MIAVNSVFLADPYEEHSGSLRLITIKPMTAQPTYSYASPSSRSQDSVVVNGEVRNTHSLGSFSYKLRYKISIIDILF